MFLQVMEVNTEAGEESILPVKLIIKVFLIIIKSTGAQVWILLKIQQS